uniref:DNA/RNA non-specific endonuclease domain-containing protein n=1 Tax=Gouania willdenowi TaxID=441366 RepID=A0A8C5GC35_GOUWI
KEGCGSSSLLVFSPLFPVSECNEFFLNKQPPWVPGILENGKILNQDRYKNKIPLFSAYKYRGNGDKREREGWYTEPKADLEDYINSTIYNKGHLFPFSHGFSEDDKLSTNTLTNIVPQVKTFNGGSWANMETCTKCVLDQLCLNNKGTSEGSVVVKANQLNDRVNIPDRAYWGENKEGTSNYLRTITLNDLQRETAPGLVVFEELNLISTFSNMF